MSRVFFGLEKGVDIYAENGALLSRLLSGTAAPDGLGDQSSAPIGSLYIRSGTGELYQKIANAGNSSDYQLNGSASAVVGKWREETVSVVTNDTQGAGTRDVVASPFTDDSGTALPVGAFIVGEYIISDADGTPALLEITAVAGDDVTFAAAADPLVAEDTFVCRHYLPDPDGGENRALVNYNGTVVVKLSDIDWSIATGINLSGSYAAASGNVAPNDTVEAAIAKLDGVNDNQDTLLGTAQGATNLGAFATPGSFLLTATETVKSALQKLADYLFGIKVTQTSGITASTVVDSLAHATYKKVSWHVEVFVTGTPANRESFIIDALTDGTNVDDTKYAKLKLGAVIAGLTSSVAISGANLQLSIASTPSVTVNVRRITVI